jgi:hypothetical protein
VREGAYSSKWRGVSKTNREMEMETEELKVALYNAK